MGLTSATISPEEGFQQSVLPSLPELRRRPASIVHQERERTPFSCPVKIYPRSLVSSYSSLARKRLGTHLLGFLPVPEIPEHDDRIMIIIRSSRQFRRLPSLHQLASDSTRRNGTHVIGMPLDSTDTSLPSSSPSTLSQSRRRTSSSSSRITQSRHFPLTLQIPYYRVATVGTSSKNVRDVRVPSESRDVVDGTRTSSG